MKGAHFFSTTAEITSKLWGSDLEMIAESMDGVMCISLSRDPVLWEEIRQRYFR